MAKLEEIYLDCHSVGSTLLSCSIETNISLFCLNYVELRSVKIFLLCSAENSQACCLPMSALDELNTELVTQFNNDFHAGVNHCKRPSARSSDGGFVCVHSGLCNMLRLAIRTAHLNNPDRKYNELLGYHENFLKACAEVSAWTKFCEILLPRKIENLLHWNVVREADVSLCLPEEVVMFNNNFKQPLKITNINKTKRKMFKDLNKADDSCYVKDHHDIVLEHKFAEGSATDMSITDLILFPCIHQYLVSEVWIAPAVRAHLDLVYEWYRRMLEVPSIKHVFQTCGYCQPSFDLGDTAPSLVTVPDVSEEAVRDQEKAKKRTRTRLEDVQPILTKLEESHIVPVVCDHPCLDDLKLDWDMLPEATHPATGDLPQKRVERKCQQLENMVKAVSLIAKPGDRIVDFCSGGGHVGILLAYFLPRCKIVLIENKEESLQRGVDRIRTLGLTNVDVFQSNLDYYHGHFDIGLCLHACGSATDMVLQKCIERDAAFVICPCCYGGISDTLDLKFPRSNKFIEAGVSNQEYLMLARVADQTEVKITQAELGKYCMQLIDTDRSLYAGQFGYDIKLCSLSPLSCTPKNNLLIGIKSDKITGDGLIPCHGARS